MKFARSIGAERIRVEMETVCTACGNQVAPGDQFCRGCGKAVSATLAATPAASIPAAIPVPQTIGPAETSGKAITSLICGPFVFRSICFYCCRSLRAYCLVGDQAECRTAER